MLKQFLLIFLGIMEMLITTPTIAQTSYFVFNTDGTVALPRKNNVTRLNELSIPNPSSIRTSRGFYTTTDFRVGKITAMSPEEIVLDIEQASYISFPLGSGPVVVGFGVKSTWGISSNTRSLTLTPPDQLLIRLKAPF